MHYRQWEKLSFSAILLTFSALVLHWVTAPPIEGMWANVYTNHPIFWVLFLAVATLLIITTTRRSYPWWVVIGLGATAIVALGAWSVQWGVPYAKQDPWMHLAFARSQTFFGINPYPALHSLIMITSTLTGLPILHYTTVMGVIAPAIGTVGLGAFLSRLPIEKQRTQPTYFALLPAIAQNFVTRPFTVSFAVLLPISLLLFTIYLQQSGRSKTRKSIQLLMWLFPAMVVWHPQLIWHVGIVVSIGWVVSHVINKTNLWQSISRTTAPARKISVAYIAIPWILVVFYLLFMLPVGERIIIRTVAAYVATTATSTAPASSSGLGVFAIFTSLDAATEALARLLYPLLLSIPVGAAILAQIWRRDIDRVLFSLTIAGGVMAGAFFAVFLVSNSLGLERFISLLPFVFLPAVPYALRQYPATRAILLACCLTAGVLGVYPSSFAGEAGGSTTAASAAQIEWVSNHGEGADIVHGGVVRQLMAATPNENAWTRYESLNRSTRPWNVHRDSLYLIQASDRANLAQYIDESGNMLAKSKYTSFVTTSEQIYANGAGGVYQANQTL